MRVNVTFSTGPPPQTNVMPRKCGWLELIMQRSSFRGKQMGKTPTSKQTAANLAGFLLRRSFHPRIQYYSIGRNAQHCPVTTNKMARENDVCLDMWGLNHRLSENTTGKHSSIIYPAEYEMSKTRAPSALARWWCCIHHYRARVSSECRRSSEYQTRHRKRGSQTRK